MLNCCENSQDQRFPLLLTFSLCFPLFRKWQECAIFLSSPLLFALITRLCLSFICLSLNEWERWIWICFFLFHPLLSPPVTPPPPLSLLQSISRSLLFFGVHSVCACVTVCERESSNCVSVWLWGSCEVHLTDRPSPAAVPFSCGRPAAWWAAKEPPSWERIQPALFVRNGEKECRRDTKAAGE